MGRHDRWLRWGGAGVVAVAAGALAAGTVASPAAEFGVALTVQESAGVDRKGEPISGGVPLPRGMFDRGQAFALQTAEGRGVPCQVTPLVVETDGTVRWILLDFQDDVAAGQTNAYVLRAAGRAVAPAGGLKVEEGPGGVTVDTGKVRFTVSREKPFGLFDSVRLGDRAVVTGGVASYDQMQGREGWDDAAEWKPRKYAAGPPETLKVWYAGPMRVTVEAAGHFADDPLGAGYRAWITAWAGQSRVRVKYSLANSNPDQRTAILVRRSTVELKLASGEGAMVGAGKPIAAQGGGVDSPRAARGPPGGGLARGQGGRRWRGALGKHRAKDLPAGWIAAGEGGPFVCDVLFATNPARRLAAGKGRLALEGIAERFEVPRDPKAQRAQPWMAEGFWLYDCSHHTSEYLFDFAPAGDAAALDALARAARSRLWVRAPGEWYSACDVLGTGRFGTVADEKACYEKWGWTFKDKQLPDASAPVPGAFVASEDNHYESEADSVQGLLLMYLRTGQRGWFDLGEGWARYHMDLQAWRTDGWRWKDGAIWFPSGGPQGNKRVRADWNFRWGPDWDKRKGNADCIDLWRHSRSKSCYCHFYGSGLADYYCLTGDRDALEAAIDDVEQKDDEFRRHGKFAPGTSAIGSIRGFGRGFEVMTRVLMADPGNVFVADLCHLSARTLWESPLLDERGFHASRIGGGFGGMPVKDLSANVRRWMDEQGIRFTETGGTVDTLAKGDQAWQVRCFGGTWQHIYVQNGADLYARWFDDEDMRDFTIAFAEMSCRFMLSPKCHQTWYYTYFDVPDLGMVFDPWAFDHAATVDGEGCVHSGWYTRFFPDACARGYSWTGDRGLLEKAKAFWYYGSKREYQTKGLRGGKDEIGMFAGHVPPKDDQVLSTSRLFWEASHPRKDAEPPAAVEDLAVRRFGGGRAEVRFTAPADAGGGGVARYQVKVAGLPIVPYEAWEYARDIGTKRNWWRRSTARASRCRASRGRRSVSRSRPCRAARRSTLPCGVSTPRATGRPCRTWRRPRCVPRP